LVTSRRARRSHGAGELERLSVAVDLARRVQGKLNGFFLAKDDDTQAESARSLFERAVVRSPLETSWRVIDGRADARLLYMARRSDLVILPRAGAVHAGRERGPDYLALQAGRPLLILPAQSTGLSVGNAVVVGWNDSREAARAIHDAMPILTEAEHVLVLTVRKPGQAPLIADVALRQHLRQHGVVAELEHRSGEDPAEEIAATAQRINADMVVIGLRGSGDDAGNDLGVSLCFPSHRLAAGVLFPLTAATAIFRPSRLFVTLPPSHQTTAETMRPVNSAPRCPAGVRPQQARRRWR
jgi:nucleotide-binding universal stress UspA family protein